MQNMTLAPSMAKRKVHLLIFDEVESLNPMLSPLEVVQRQFDAYNERNLDKFLANFSATIKVYKMPATEPGLVGKGALAEFYATKRFNHVGLRAELLSRMELGNKIVDRERIWGVNEEPLEMVVIFEVKEGLIETIWGFAPD
jgi:hypothetical protein